MTPSEALHGNGQSVRLDCVRRNRLDNGGPERLIVDDGAADLPFAQSASIALRLLLKVPATGPGVQLIERSGTISDSTASTAT